MSTSKYHSKRTVFRGERFDSRKEARRYAELLILLRAGDIKDLRRQVEYELIPAQYEDVQIGVYQIGDKKGQPKYKTVCREKPVKYVADFVYFTKRIKPTNVNGKAVLIESWEEVVEDAKGIKTDTYIIKRKLMRYIKDIVVKEV